MALVLASWLISQPERDLLNVVQSSRARLSEVCLGKGSLTADYRQLLEKLAAEIKYQLVVEANIPFTLHSLFRAVYGVFCWDKETRLSSQLVSNSSGNVGRPDIFLSVVHTSKINVYVANAQGQKE